MVLRDDPGIRIDETWDALGMRASGSHDLVLEGVRLGEDRFLGYRNKATPSPRGRASGVWFALGVAATTTGVARAARDYAVDFARERTPTGLRTISEFPGVRRRIARIDLLLQRNHALIADAAAAWESGEDEGMPAADRVAVAKVDALNNAIEAVDEAMRVVGGVGLQKQPPHRALLPRRPRRPPQPPARGPRPRTARPPRPRRVAAGDPVPPPPTLPSAERQLGALLILSRSASGRVGGSALPSPYPIPSSCRRSSSIPK